MQERFYRIKKESKTHKKLANAKKQKKKMREFMKNFLQANGFETDRYYVNNSRLMLDLTEHDSDKFKDQIMKDGKTFKKNSALNRSYLEEVKKNDIDVSATRGLDLWDYECFICNGARYRQFEDEETGTFYLSIAPETDEPFNITNDAEEIKGSEFFVVLERVKDNK